jgi:hypothetical protein
MRFLFSCLLLCLFACGADAPESAPAAKPAVAIEPVVARELTEEEHIDIIRQDFADIGEKLAAGEFAVDSIDYNCEDMMQEGRFMIYSEGDDVRMATHDFSAGGHSGEVQYWYFRQGELFFHMRETGYWQFGGELTLQEDGSETPGTIDHLTEERHYIVDGKVVRKLFKEYQLKSWEVGVDPTTVPNTAVDTDGSLPDGYEWLTEVMKGRKVICKTEE